MIDYVYYKHRDSPFGYSWRTRKLPDWLKYEIIVEGDSKVVTCYSRIHKNTIVKMNPSYSTEWSNIDIIKDISANICIKFGVTYVKTYYPTL